jgi:hypothetical protein
MIVDAIKQIYCNLLITYEDSLDYGISCNIPEIEEALNKILIYMYIKNLDCNKDKNITMFLCNIEKDLDICDLILCEKDEILNCCEEPLKIIIP